MAFNVTHGHIFATELSKGNLIQQRYCHNTQLQLLITKNHLSIFHG
jgi:hypothetical protein